jgi:hypothetical protein
VVDIFDTFPLEASLSYAAVSEHRLKPYAIAFVGFIGVAEQLEPGKDSLLPVPISDNF